MGKLLVTFLLLFAFLSVIQPVFAESQIKEEYIKAQVVKVINQGEVISNGQKNLYQDLEVKTSSGQTLSIHYGDPVRLTADREVAAGDQIVILKSTNPVGKTSYSVYDKYRFNNVLLVILFFVILVLAIAQLKGVGSLVGLIASLAVILFFIVPNILKGADPLFISIVGSIIILFISTYVAHGISKQTTVALVSTFISLFITAFLAHLFTNFSNLSGVGNEDIASLQIGTTSIINLKGLFLGGIIIGTLGALNDVTISQAATIFELAKTDHKVKILELARRGFNVGREHILSLVNTLVLAYAGSSLFIFIFLVLNPNKVPYWVILNTETISGEIVSTIVGSIGLILAVPIVTLLASWTVLELVNKSSNIKK